MSYIQFVDYLIFILFMIEDKLLNNNVGLQLNDFVNCNFIFIIKSMYYQKQQKQKY